MAQQKPKYIRLKFLSDVTYKRTAVGPKSKIQEMDVDESWAKYFIQSGAATRVKAEKEVKPAAEKKAKSEK